MRILLAICAQYRGSIVHRRGQDRSGRFLQFLRRSRDRLEPLELLELCLSIERSMKRVRIERWGPRTIDIDVLTYGNEIIDLQGLEVPHPRMTQRAFV